MLGGNLGGVNGVSGKSPEDTVDAREPPKEVKADCVERGELRAEGGGSGQPWSSFSGYSWTVLIGVKLELCCCSRFDSSLRPWLRFWYSDT